MPCFFFFSARALGSSRPSSRRAVAMADATDPAAAFGGLRAPNVSVCGRARGGGATSILGRRPPAPRLPSFEFPTPARRGNKYVTLVYGFWNTAGRGRGRRARPNFFESAAICSTGPGAAPFSSPAPALRRALLVAARHTPNLHAGGVCGAGNAVVTAGSGDSLFDVFVARETRFSCFFNLLPTAV